MSYPAALHAQLAALVRPQADRVERVLEYAVLLHARQFALRDLLYGGRDAMYYRSAARLLKAALSSAEALRQTLAERAKHPRLTKAERGADSPEAAHDRERLAELMALAEAADSPPSKFARLLELFACSSSSAITLWAKLAVSMR